jgi:hypothetical protein
MLRRGATLKHGKNTKSVDNIKKTTDFSNNRRVEPFQFMQNEDNPVRVGLQNSLSAIL